MKLNPIRVQNKLSIAIILVMLLLVFYHNYIGLDSPNYAQNIIITERLIVETQGMACAVDDVESKIVMIEEMKAEYDKPKYNLTDEEYEIMYRIVESEATGGSTYHKMIIANVIFNRVESENFPDTIEEVVFQKNQFSPIADSRYYMVEITDSTVNAVNRAVMGEDSSDGALYFMCRKWSEEDNINWFDENLEFLFELEAHEFFR